MRVRARVRYPRVGLVGGGAGGAGLDNASIDEPDERDLLRVGLQRLRVFDVVVAERRMHAVPQSLLGPASHLAHRPLADQLTLELGEAEQDVQDQHAHGLDVSKCWMAETKVTLWALSTSHRS